MNTTHFKILLRSDSTKRDGTNSLCLYANVNGVKKYFSIHKSIDSKHWNNEKQTVSMKCQDWHDINTTIKLYINRAEKMAMLANIEGRTLTLQEIEDTLRGAQFDKNSVVAFIENDILEFKNRFRPATIATYRTAANKLKEFRSNITFQELTPFFWRQYENHLIKNGNNKNTIHKYFSTLKVFIFRAIEQGIIKENPLKSVKIRRTEGNRQYLTLAEVQTLESIYKGFLTKEYKKTLHYFLFACFTGLRFSDVLSLKFSNIEDGKFIVKNIVKTSKIERIPLMDRAKKLIPKMGLSQQLVFDVYCNQVTNRHLKDIMKLAKIDKTISFHSARHTFATVTLELGGNLATIQKLLGHSKIQTTQIYAKVMDKSMEADVQRWNKVK